MSKQNCYYCKYCWRDIGVGARECTCDDENFTEEEIVKYDENMEDGCPHFQEGENITKYGFTF